eukprot:TRINITY_DN61333_c0_g1_i1.p1 TRINITY_DN61333_c0_g1~~TRINITY_DN61333_c0_g1_i1.p1  ORF type:complete len:352 (-),score=50.77 TRINITY_DN61333_c0_g1_i1:18-1073(-)
MARFSLLTTFSILVKGMNPPAPGQLRGLKIAVGKSEETLPDVESLLSSHTFSAVKSTVAALEKHLAEEQHQTVDALNQIKATYEAKLALQKRNNLELEHSNQKIASHILVLYGYNKGLRLRVSDLETSTSALKSELDALSANLSLAQDFVQEGIAASATIETAFQELGELAEKDNTKLLSVSGFDRVTETPSFVEFDWDVHERSRQVIMDTVLSSLAKLSSETNTSKSVLNAAFKKQLSDAIKKHDVLMRDQAMLNQSNSKAEELRDQLSAAVNHLTKTRDKLLARIKTVKTLAFRIGGSHQSLEEADGRHGEGNGVVTTERLSSVASNSRHRRIVTPNQVIVHGHSDHIH